MGSNTAIEWTDATWNPFRGCSRVSSGCERCYAEQVSGRFSGPGQPYEGLTRKTSQGWRWTGEVRQVPGAVTLPLRWKKPRRIFVNSMSDLFHESLTEIEERRYELRDVFRVMARAHWHTFQVLTKRAAGMYYWMLQEQRESGGLTMEDGTVVPFPLPNVHLGVSVENQTVANERIPWLMQTPAALRFLSVEPLISPVWLWRLEKIGWVIVGGESGPRHRPMEVSWMTALAQECLAAHVPVYIKQDAALRPGQQGRIPDDVWALKQLPGGLREEQPV